MSSSKKPRPARHVQLQEAGATYVQLQEAEASQECPAPRSRGQPGMSSSKKPRPARHVQLQEAGASHVQLQEAGASHVQLREDEAIGPKVGADGVHDAVGSGRALRQLRLVDVPTLRCWQLASLQANFNWPRQEKPKVRAAGFVEPAYPSEWRAGGANRFPVGGLAFMREQWPII